MCHMHRAQGVHIIVKVVTHADILFECTFFVEFGTIDIAFLYSSYWATEIFKVSK